MFNNKNTILVNGQRWSKPASLEEFKKIVVPEQEEGQIFNDKKPKIEKTERTNFIVLPVKFVQISDKLTPSAIRVYLFMKSYDYALTKNTITKSGGLIMKPRKGKVWPSQETVSRELNMPLRTVKRAYGLLKKEKFISSERRYNNSNITTLL